MAEKAKVFEYIVVYHPNEKAKKAGEKAKLVVEKQSILAQREQEAAIHAARTIPEEYLDKLEDVEIIVRPF